VSNANCLYLKIRCARSRCESSVLPWANLNVNAFSRSGSSADTDCNASVDMVRGNTAASPQQAPISAFRVRSLLLSMCLMRTLLTTTSALACHRPCVSMMSRLVIRTLSQLMTPIRRFWARTTLQLANEEGEDNKVPQKSQVLLPRF
jgi:hypothetical protein